jgi:hypothetical protein
MVMRYVTLGGGSLLVAATLFSSCTCHKDVSESGPHAFNAAPPGFRAGANATPQARVQVQPATPAPQPTVPQVAAASPAPLVDLPSDFPQDVPVYKDAAVTQVQNLANNAHNVIFRTTAPVAEVYTFYEKKMTDAGWDITQQIQRGSHAFMSFKKGDLITNLTVAEDPQNPDRKVIAIMYEQEKPLDFDEF